MCQIHIVKREEWNKEQEIYEKHLTAGARANPHGSAALFINEDGEHSLIRAMDFEVILDMMVLTNWDTVVIHQRYTTQGASTLANTHMWQVGDFLYCHNGVLKSEESAAYRVDSNIIGAYLEDGNIWDALAYCQSEEYANVFIVNLVDKRLWVTRSQTNTLFTDGKGQYSTRSLAGRITNAVPKNSTTCYHLDIDDAIEEYWSQYDEMDYQERVAAASGSSMEQDTGTDVSEFDVDTEELERKLYSAMADGDDVAYNHYNYLIEKARQNG